VGKKEQIGIKRTSKEGKGKWDISGTLGTLKNKSSQKRFKKVIDGNTNKYCVFGYLYPVASKVNVTMGLKN
jgi:hypothetical protein